MNIYEHLTEIILEKKESLLKKGYSKKEVDTYVDSIVEHVSTVVLVGHIEVLTPEERADFDNLTKKEDLSDAEKIELLRYTELSVAETESLLEALKKEFLES